MLRSWPGYLPSMVAVPVTLVLTALYAVASGDWATSGPVQGMILLLLVPVPMAIAVIWGVVFLASRPYRAAIFGAAVWLAISHILLPGEVVWQLAGYVAAGLAAGGALGMRLRPDAALVIVSAALVPMIVWAVIQIPVDEQLRMVSGEMLTVLEDNLPAGATDKQRARTLEEEARNLDRMSALAARIYPFVIGVGLLGQGCIVLVMVWFSAGRLKIAIPDRALPPFSRWRLPFYLVWLLIGSVALILTRAPYLATAGLNLTLLVACLLSVQGIAVQFHVTNRMFSNTGRLLYWLVMGVVFGLLILASGVLLGLVDQWVDLRRLQAEPGDDDGNVGESGGIQ